jgi:hypothetical protein
MIAQNAWFGVRYIPSKFHSTNVLSDILSVIDGGNTVLLLMRDMSADFDTIAHHCFNN